MASDRFKLPDARRTFGSPGGGYELVISTPDGWASKRVAAALYRVDQAEGQGKRERLWERELPYKFGPRHAVVNDAGVVVLIDEWRNVKSDHAVRVIGPDGTVLADHPFEAVRAALEMEAGRLMDAVEGGGWWVAGTPRLSEEGNWMDVPAGGRFLRVRTADGALSAVDEREGKGGRE